MEKTLDDRRRSPRADFLSDFLAKAEAAGELSPLEMMIQIVQLIVGGSDTTRVAIVAQVALLLQHREQWDAVCRDPALIPGAVAEAVRFEPSGASFARVTMEDIELGGAIFPAGQLVICSTMSGAGAMKASISIPTRLTFVGPINRGCTPRLVPAFIVASARRWHVPNSRRAWRH